MFVPIPSLEEGTLPPMLVSQNCFGQYEVLTYEEQWDHVNQRSWISQCRAIGVPVMVEDDEDAVVRFTKDFIRKNPWIKNMR